MLLATLSPSSWLSGARGQEEDGADGVLAAGGLPAHGDHPARHGGVQGQPLQRWIQPRDPSCIRDLHPHDRRIPDAGGGAGQQTVHARPTHTGQIVSNCSQIFFCKYFLQMILSQGECEDQLPAGQAGGQLEGDGGAGRGRGHVLQRILQGENVIFLSLKVCC